MRRLAVFLLASVLSGCGGYALDVFLYEPQRTEKYELELEGTDAQSTVTADRVTLFEDDARLTTPSGIRLGAVLVTANVSPPRGYVLYFHGKGSHLGRQFHRVKRVANAGYDVLAIDYRGWGVSSDVKPTEDGIAEDSATALAWMEAYAGGRDRIVYYGHSFGTAVATQRAELDAPSVLVLESAFASLAEFKTDATMLDFPGSFIADADWGTSRRIKSVHSPVLILHGLEDDFVRPEFSKLLYDNAPGPKQLELVDGADHGDVPVVLGDRYPELLNAWIGGHLSEQP